jgi:serine/threonine protein kinase
MLYELLSGVLPFAGDSVAELARAVADEDPIPLDRRVPGIPSALARAVMRCLEKDPDDRPASVRELMAVLSAVHPTLPPPVAEGDLAPTERHSVFPPKAATPPITPKPRSPRLPSSTRSHRRRRSRPRVHRASRRWCSGRWSARW